MIILLRILAFVVCYENIIAQDLITVESCKKESFYKVIQKVDVKSNNMNLTSDNNYQILLLDSFPPLDWWNPTIKIKEYGQIKNKENPSWRYTRNKKYSDQKLVKIINNSDDTLIIELPDRCLMLGLQAKNLEGEWIDVEECFQGACGNSFFGKENKDIFLPNNQWLTFVEFFAGNIKTKYRLKFQLTRNAGFIYSNEVEGTINECRFVQRCHTIVRKSTVK